ncbi:hypothetical protein BDY24DRAFT_146829 [Mrakia frigida]|uniref:uncharacterized protein n=1 Tax=Mrakia frigida TaxID=29902 RepID=UPI003FCBF00A
MSVSAFVAPTASRIALPSIQSIRAYGEERGSSYERPVNPPSATLYCANLAYGINENDIVQHFAAYGCNTARIPNNREGRPAGYAWVEFSSIEDATAAKDNLTDSELAGRNIRLDFGKARGDVTSRPQNPPSNVLFFGGIADTTEGALTDFVAQSGASGFSVRIGLDRETMEPRGFAHVEFGDVEQASAAKAQLEGQAINGGNPPRIDFNKPREERSFGGES